MKFFRAVKTINTKLLIKKNLQIQLKNSTEHASQPRVGDVRRHREDGEGGARSEEGGGTFI